MGNLLIKLENREMGTKAGRWERGSVPSGAPRARLCGAGRHHWGTGEDWLCNQTYSVMLLQTRAQKVKVKLNLWQIQGGRHHQHRGGLKEMGGLEDQNNR